MIAGWFASAYEWADRFGVPLSTTQVAAVPDGIQVRIDRSREAVGECRAVVEDLFKALASADIASRKKIRYPTAKPKAEEQA